MATILPNVVGMYFTRRIEVNVQQAELSLVGLFHNRSYSGFPHAPIEMTVFTMLRGGRGEGILQLAVYSLNRMEEYDQTSDWIYRQQKWLKFPDDPNYLVTIEPHLRSLTFFEPGDYLFVLTLDEEVVTERQMSVRKRKVKS